MNLKGILSTSVCIVVVLSLLNNESLRAQDAYYEDKSDSIPLWYLPGKMVIKFHSTPSLNIEEALGSDPAFDTAQEPELITYDFYYVWLVEDSTVAGALGRLDTNGYVEIANPIYLEEEGDSTELVAFDRVSVKFLDTLSRDIIDSLNTYWGVEIVDSVLGVSNYYSLLVTGASGHSVLEVANTYEQDDRTEFAIPSFLPNIELQSIDDQFFGYQWNYNNTGQLYGTPDADIDAVEAWEIETGDSSIVIAVIDEGVESHEDLPSGKLVDGYDFVGDDVKYAGGPDSDPSPGDACRAHGMACSGLIAATHNELGVRGLAPGCKIMPLKVSGIIMGRPLPIWFLHRR